MRRVLTATVVSAFALSGLSACGSDDPAASRPTATPTPVRGLPDGASGQENSALGVVAGDEPGLIWVVSFGSSTNPNVVRDVTADGQTVTVKVAGKEGVPATSDFVPTSSALILPAEVDLDEPVTFEFGKQGALTLESTEPGTEAWVEPAE